MRKRKIGRWVVLAVAVVVVVAAVIFFKQYYDQRYAVAETYYTVVPLDYDITPHVDAQGGRLKDYTLTGYDAAGQARTLEFTVLVDAHGANLYPGGTYLQIDTSQQLVLNCRALDVSAVPATAAEKIAAGFVPSPAATLPDYAAERTGQLVAGDTGAAQATCTADGDTLVYTYVYGGGAGGADGAASGDGSADGADGAASGGDAQAQAEAAANLLDPVYTAQFRADQQAFSELTAIELVVKLNDGTVVFSKQYDTRIEFGYELN